VAVVACFLAGFAASYVWRPFARHLGGWFLFCCILATAQYFYLFDRNHADLNWLIGSYITVIAVCAVLQTARALLLYSLCVAALSCVVLLRAPQVPYVVFAPGMATILLFANLGLHARLRLSNERRRAEVALTLANRELESFSYSVAHDLRAPVRAIHGFSQILVGGWGDHLDGEAKDLLSKITAQTELMAQLIDGLLRLARLSRAKLNQESVDLTRLANEVFTQLRASQPEREVAFTNAVTHPAQGDPTLLRAVLENLLGNAWKFTSARKDARITLGSAQKGDLPVYFVQDNGAGFNIAYVDKLFAPFQRLHPSSEFPGTGIGLAMVHRIVSRHGGRVWAEGAVGDGATFFFTLQDSPEARPQ
jgi:signal transduction histidine kinase